MSDTFFTASPHWAGYIVLYLFVGGIAGGACFLAALLRLAGKPEDRPTIRLGYRVALAGAVLSGLLLTLDLTRPLRFWHMLLFSQSGAPLLKTWSPMSVGAWALVLFGAIALLATLGTLGEDRPGWRRVAFLARGRAGTLIAVTGGVLGLFIAGYTGVLLAVTNRPIWADSTWLGALFLCSGVSTAAATLLLLGRFAGQERATGRWLIGFDRRVLALELVVLGAFLVSLGGVARLWLGWNGAVLAVGVLGAGILAPLLLEGAAQAHERTWRGMRPGTLAALLVLAGGLLLRLVIITASSGVAVTASRAAGP